MTKEKEKTNTYSTEPHMAKCVIAAIIYINKQNIPLFIFFYKIYIYIYIYIFTSCCININWYEVNETDKTRDLSQLGEGQQV